MRLLDALEERVVGRVEVGEDGGGLLGGRGADFLVGVVLEARLAVRDLDLLGRRRPLLPTCAPRYTEDFAVSRGVISSNSTTPAGKARRPLGIGRRPCGVARSAAPISS